jgi:hypothetical protein
MTSSQFLSACLIAGAFHVASAEPSICEFTCGQATADQGGGTQATIGALSWLAGNWIEERKDQTIRERWSGPYGDMLLGVGVTERAKGKTSFEFFRIAKTATGVSYFASPNATPPTEFKAIEHTSTKVVFENKAHDFPQRVIYIKNADGTLAARIEGTLNGKLVSESWLYQPER